MSSVNPYLTVVILTFNEEKRIQRVIDNYVNHFKILILDNFSSDNTIKICKSNNIHYKQIQNNGHLDSKVISEIICNIDTEWVFFVQCSEFSPPEFIIEIKKLIQKKDLRAILFNRVSYTGGIITHNLKRLYKQKKNHHVFSRLFNKNYIEIRFSKIHYEFPIIINKKNQFEIISEEINKSLLHFRNIDIDSGEIKHMNYSKFDANQMFVDGKRGSYLRVIFRPIKSILFFINLDFIKDFNYYKFITLVQHFQYILSVELKLLEKTKEKDLIFCNEKNKEVIEKFTNIEQ